MDDEFQDLRNVIYKTEAEFKRFRQLVVNSVMATDIVDKDLKGTHPESSLTITQHSTAQRLIRLV